jgi:hypothetical protein
VQEWVPLELVWVPLELVWVPLELVWVPLGQVWVPLEQVWGQQGLEWVVVEELDGWGRCHSFDCKSPK